MRASGGLLRSCSPRKKLRRTAAYHRTFAGVDADVVLADLEDFCHAYQTTLVPGDTHQSAMLEGRRQVFLHVFQYMRYDPAEIADMIARGQDKEAEFD